MIDSKTSEVALKFAMNQIIEMADIIDAIRRGMAAQPPSVERTQIQKKCGHALMGAQQIHFMVEALAIIGGFTMHEPPTEQEVTAFNITLARTKQAHETLSN